MTHPPAAIPDARPGSPLALAPAGGLPMHGEHVAYSGTSTVELNVAALWRILWEWRWLILSTLAVGVAGAVIITLLTTPTYRATATLELNPPSVSVTTKEERSSVMAYDSQFVGTQLGLLRSRALAERVVQDLNLAANPAIVPPGLDRTTAEQAAIGMVQGSLNVVLEPQSRLVYVSMVSTDPQMAAKVANGAVDGYVNSTLERRYQSSSYARDFLQRQIATVRRDLENSERQLVAYAQQQRLITTGDSNEQGSDGGSLTGDTLVALNQALAQAQTRRIAAEGRYRESLSAGPTSETSERTTSLRQQVASLTAEYRQKRTTFQPDYPDMVRLKAQIDSLNQAIAAETREIRAGRVGTLRQDYQAAQTEEANIRSRVEQLSSQVLDLRGRNIRYKILQRDVDTNRSLYDALLQRYKEIGVAGGIGAATASVVDRARVPGGPFKPNLYLNLLVGLALGLVGGIAAALLLEFVNDTIKSPDDVRDKLKLPFLGGVPSSRSANPVEELGDPLSGVSEAYYSLATSLQYTSETGVPKTLLVTSTRPAEGKSTSAWALAHNLARLGKSVLLIDADMRRPAFVTGVDGEAGLSNLLTNNEPIRSNVLRTEVEGLYMIPAGPVPPSPPELLAAPRMAVILAEAAEAFDVVIIDGPPVMGLADVPLLATVVRATVMVVEAGRTRTRAAIEAHNRLRAANAHVVGAILTRFKAQAAYGYGYGYGYGYNSRARADSYTYKIDDQRRRRIQLSIMRPEDEQDK